MRPLTDLAELQPGESVEVVRDFVDFDGDAFRAGTRLTLVSHRYFAYDGGHTFEFEGATLRLAEIDPESAQVLDRPSEFFRRV